jgi:3-phosphoshikimate 1-carboxyvinyltransferase
MGADVEALPDGFVVRGPTRLAGASLDAAGDHRIGMALAVAASLAKGESVLAGAEWVDVSYPGFFDALAGSADSTSSLSWRSA